MQDNLQNLIDEIATRQRAQKALDTEFESRKSTFDSLTEAIETSKRDLAGTKDELKALTAQVTNQRTLLAKAQSDLVTVTSEHEKRQAELAVLDKSIATKQVRQTELARKIAEIKSTAPAEQPPDKAVTVATKPAESATTGPNTSAALGVSTSTPTVEPPINRETLAQIGSFRSVARAKKQWNAVRRANTDLFDGLEPYIERVDLGEDKGVWYRLMVAALPTVQDARRFCRTLNNRSGRIACFMAQR